MKSPSYWLALILLTPIMMSPLASAEEATSADTLKARYLATSARVSTNSDSQAEGLFMLKGPLNISTGSASAIAGTNTKRDEALALAQQFLRENETLLAASSEHFLLAKRSEDKFGSQHFRFQRTLSAIPVADMEVLVHVNKEGEISGVNGNIVRPTVALINHMTNADTSKLLSKDAAFERVATLRNTSSQALRLLSATLSLSNSAPHIRWHVDINSIAEIGRYSYWLDAETGELIDVKNTLRHPIPLIR